MEVIPYNGHLPTNSWQQFKRIRSCPCFEDQPKFTLEDGKEYKIIDDVECTTLLKFVPYDRIQKDDQEEIDAYIDIIIKKNDVLRKMKTNTQNLLLFDEDYEQIDICGVGSDILPCRSGPVLQVIDVTVSNKNHPKEFKIYGEISMTDYKGDTFYIYKCEPEDPEYVIEVLSGCNLYLTQCPIVPAMGGKVKFSLTNKDSGVQIIDKECDVKNATEDTEKGTFTLECAGIGGYCAKMVFTKIPFAVLSKVKMFLRYTTPHLVENKKSFEVQGEVTANEVIVMNRNEREEMEPGVWNLFIPYRYVFAASVLSSLDVKVELYSGNLELANDTYKVATCPGSMSLPRTSVFECKAEGCLFEVDAYWVPHDDFFCHSDLKWLSSMADPDESPPDGPLFREMYQPPTPDPVEVFSVLIGGISAPRDLCGTIVVRDDGNKVYIFARNTNCPDKLSSNEQQFRTVSLAWPDRWVLEKDLLVYLKLKDVQDHVVCSGQLSWCTGKDGRYDRRLCDVFQREGCFVAVHYSVFKNGKKAMLSVQCIDGGPYILYGSVFAQYDNHDYPSLYDEQCYRSTIFRRSKEECVKVKNGSEVRLSKSHVSAPSDCKQLIVVADLWVLHPNMTSFKPVTGELHFESRRYESQSEDLGGCFVVTVNWASSSPPP